MEFEISLRAAYADTDQMGFVHHSNYVKYLERARWEAFRKIGLTYKEIEDRGILMPVIDVKLRYLKPIYYDDLVTIKMQPNLISATKLSIDYKIFNASEELVHIAYTALTFMNKVTKKPCRIPAFIEEAITELVCTH